MLMSPFQDRTADTVIYGAVRIYEGDGLNPETWRVITDPVEFATASDEVVPGASVEEVVAALNAAMPGGGLLSWYAHRTLRGKTTIFRGDMRPTLTEGADPFAAARAAEGEVISVPRLTPPEGAEYALDSSPGHGGLLEEAWVWDGFLYRVFYRGATLVFTTDPKRLKSGLGDVKDIRRRLKARERRKKRADTYTTLPSAKARKAFSLSREMVEVALTTQTEKGISFKISYHYPMNKETPRATTLKLTHSLLSVWDKHQCKCASLERIREVFQPLHDNWEVAKTKEDAEFVGPILDILWPDTDHELE